MASCCPSLDLMESTKPVQSVMAVPPIRRMRSPSCNPAIAAGFPGSTVPRTGSVEGVVTPLKKKMLKKRNTGRMRFIPEPARMTSIRAGSGFSQ